MDNSSANYKSDLQKKYELIADDGFDEPFTKEPKRSGSDTRSKIRWRSTKVMAKVNHLFMYEYS